MNEREIGYMQIANERIMIVEPTVKLVDAVQDPKFALIVPVNKWPMLDHAIYWTAVLPDGRVIAVGMLMQDSPTDEHPRFWAAVVEARQRNGLGRLMFQLATDQAIHYRKRTISAEVSETNVVAIRLLEDQEFEKRPEFEHRAEHIVLRKDLKWA